MERAFETLVKTPSDINEHLCTLRDLAKECETILECGSSFCVASWALAFGLGHNEKPVKVLTCNNIHQKSINQLAEVAKTQGVTVKPIYMKPFEIEGEFDMVFIDSFHCYGQLKRELERHKGAKKYIVMHDTEIDGTSSEYVRGNFDLDKVMRETGWSKEEVMIGLWPALDEFLEAHTEWVFTKEYRNNNGLTILERNK